MIICGLNEIRYKQLFKQRIVNNECCSVYLDHNVSYKKKPHHGVLRGGAREGGGISPLEAIYNIAYMRKKVKGLIWLFWVWDFSGTFYGKAGEFAGCVQKCRAGI